MTPEVQKSWEALHEKWREAVQHLTDLGTAISFFGAQLARKTLPDQDSLIKLDDGSFVTREWLMASLVQQRQMNRRMQEELEGFKSYIEAQRHQQIAGDKESEGNTSA